MTTIIGVRFKDSGKIYYFDPHNLELQQGDIVIVDTARGPEMAKVAYEQCDVSDSEIVGELKSVLRRAEPSDFERMRMLQARHDDIMARCAEKIRAHDLPMDLVKTEYSFDGSRLTFYFTSEQRVDFRMLVRDLARTFKSRIELRQIGPRDEAKLLGGIGPCGRALCCATFLPDYARVSIKMAKDQDLPLNPSKISGVCGRLLCCLSYEHQQYVDMKAELPGKGDWVQTPDGPGNVIGVNVLKSSVTVQLASSGMQEDYTVSQIQAAAEAVNALAGQRARAGLAPGSSHTDLYGEDNGSDLLAILDEEEADLNGADRADDDKPSASSRKPSQSRSKRAEGSRSRSTSQKAPASGQQQAPPIGDPASDQTKGDQPNRKRSKRRKRKPAASKAEGSEQAAAPPPPQASAASEEGPKKKSSRSRPRRRKRKAPDTPPETEA